VSYTVGNTTMQPTWLEPRFLFPDWDTNSDFHVVMPISLVASNADGLPVAQSILANNDLEITIRYEMVDTVTGMPMGVAASSAAGTGNSVGSNRYVLNQAYTIRNISGSTITGLNVFQLLHGFTSQRGVFDNRTYPGKLSTYHHDVTLAGIDAGTIGAGGSSASGLEDYIGFSSSVAPTAFEIGHYGIEGIDDHGTAKPSDGVHLSIEADWATAPYSDRQGTDFFAPNDRWIAGAQRYALGSIADGQSVSVDVMLSILTGTTVQVTGGGDTTMAAAAVTAAPATWAVSISKLRTLPRTAPSLAKSPKQMTMNCRTALKTGNSSSLAFSNRVRFPRCGIFTTPVPTMD
jgi:hypothetical protein